jgi:hypothetical protein
MCITFRLHADFIYSLVLHSLSFPGLTSALLSHNMTYLQLSPVSQATVSNSSPTTSTSITVPAATDRGEGEIPDEDKAH